MVELAFLIAGGLIVGFVLAQESKQAKTDWGQVRAAFDAYFSSPTDDNALRVLSALPSKIDDQTMDFSAKNTAIERIHQDHIGNLDELIGKGNRLALRIAYHLYKFTDGWYAESVTAVIGGSIVAMPDKFLEETLLFRKNNPPELHGVRYFPGDYDLNQILTGFIDFDSFRPEVIRKEINARIKALESVERMDLREFRNDCLGRLRHYLKKLSMEAPDFSPVIE